MNLKKKKRIIQRMSMWKSNMKRQKKESSRKTKHKKKEEVTWNLFR